MAVLIAFVSWLGVGSTDPPDDAVGLLPPPQGTALAASDAPAIEPSAPATDLLTQPPAPTATPDQAPPPPQAQPDATAPIVTPEPVRVPQATAVKPVPTATPAPTPSPRPIPVAAPDPTLAEQLLTLLDQERTALGVPRLDTHASLMLAAQEYAALLFRDRDPFQLDHYLDSGPLVRVQRQGYTGAVGEVLVTGSIDAGKLMEAWLTSPAHEQILLADKYRDVGMGCHSGPYVSDDGSTLDVAVCVGLVGYR